MTRWLVLSLGLGIAALAGYVLLSNPQSSTPRAVPNGKGGLPQEQIGEESQARLEAILRDADAGESGKP